MSTITFVRHAQPAVDGAVSPEAWPLSDDGARAARSLSIGTLVNAQVLASSERKAIETTAIATGRAPDEIQVDSGFCEVQKLEPIDSDFRDRRRAWVAGRADGRHRNWEAFADAGDRMDETLVHHRSDVVVVGTHGMILTAWLVRVGLIQPDEAAAGFWERLALPDVVKVIAHDDMRDSYCFAQTPGGDNRNFSTRQVS